MKAIEISKIIHDNCEKAPHDIGLKLVGMTCFGTSYVQRVLKIRYTKAAKIIEELEKEGLIERNEKGWNFKVV